ncbi:YitT family protein [Virgibacillus sp. CBA3643]|uniref:YczE/YyaS/YitT family protein n=1 Tax=Virgibacillus sp. CBA3643 TaxID=2942278 RepID=UPI0035A33154
MKKETGLRWLFFFAGLMVLGLGAALTIKGQRFGVGSWDVLHIGLFERLGLSIGLWSIIMGLIVITIASIGLREFPKIGTFINMTFVGIFIDFFNWLIPDSNTFSVQLIAFIIGVLLLAMGSGIYISAELGAGPRDSLMLLIVKKTHFSIAAARTIMEVVVAVAGYLLGGPLGIGTIVIAFALGPIIQVTLKYSGKLLEKSVKLESVAHGHG